MRIACINQDPGIAPGRKKGASIHIRAAQDAFRQLGAELFVLHETDDQKLITQMEAASPFDLVYERYALGRSAGAEFARRNSIPFVLEVNAPLEYEAGRWRGGATEGVRERDEIVFGAADRVIAVSSLVAAYAVDRGAPPDRVRVFPNGVDASVFRPHPEASALRSTLVPTGRFVLGFHGRLRPWHGFGQLVEATRCLIDRGLPVHLLIVGEGDFEAQLEGAVPAEHVTRVGWVHHHDMPRYVTAFDALPLTYETSTPCYFSPLKLPEAMACGVVPVVPDAGDLARIVVHESNGLLYPPGDVLALADALEWLIQNPRGRAALADEALRTARDLPWLAAASFAMGLEVGEVKS